MNEATKPELTQTMKMHLNGGKKFSLLVYMILADGRDTGITRVTETSGSPKYLRTSDKMHIGDKEFDILATMGTGMSEWIIANQQPKEKADGKPEQSDADRKTDA
jgi:hypothetical protein